MGGLSVRRGDVLRIDWERSSFNDIAVTVVEYARETCEWVPTKRRGCLPCSVARLLDPTPATATAAAADIPAAAAGGIAATPAPGPRSVDAGGLIVEIDTNFSAPPEVTAHPHRVATPLDVEPSLDSFAWPLSQAEFLHRVFRRRCLVVHGSGGRLGRLQDDLLGFDVRRLVDAASRLVVWMRARKSGQMQYIDAGPDVAYNAYLSGHTLYFNPDTSTQERYVGALCRDLGCDFGGADKEGGGGDLEVFAVDNRHSTPWHFDAQDNFSVQLRGTKRWTVASSGLADPLSNLHPRSTNRESVHSDYKVHAYSNQCGHAAPGASVDRTLRPRAEFDVADAADATAAAPAAAAAAAGTEPPVGTITESFVVRPGTVFYHPAGLWHKVDAIDDEGSLSINISLDTLRWVDVVMTRLTQRMYQLPRWRGRVQLPPPAPAATAAAGARARLAGLRAQLSGLISELKTVVEELDAEDFAPPALLLDNRPGRGGDGGGDDDDDDEDGGVAGKAARKREARERTAAASAAGVGADAFALHDCDALKDLVGLHTVVLGADDGDAEAAARTVVLRRNALTVLINAEPSDAASAVAVASARPAARGWEAHSGFGTPGFASQYCVSLYSAREQTPPVCSGSADVRAGDVHAAVLDAVKNGDCGFLPLPTGKFSRAQLADVLAYASTWTRKAAGGADVDENAVREAALTAVAALVHVGILVQVSATGKNDA
jgi:hypothetical protein